ncbi:MAG TPA: NADH-quinone oxidoreductase subunit NuoB [Smithella sp.]|nr:NADH-quinone oxidoreductase subunit NuoB [Smithella sp.]
MMNVLATALKQKKWTIDYPKGEPVLPERFRGLPVLDPAKCNSNCHACIEACPTGALKEGLIIDLGRCLFCNQCVRACPDGAISFSREFRMAAGTREALIYKNNSPKLSASLDKESKRLFSRSLKLRQVSAGGCGACEADTNVLGTIVYDLGRFGVQFVASPRHADGLLITGPVSQNMQLALEKTYKALPAPKLVIATGACSISGGPYIDHPEVLNGADPILPVDLYIPGCPPHPLTILHGILSLLGRL